MPRLSSDATLESVVARRWQGDVGDYPAALALAPDDRRLAVASIAGPITVLDVASGGTLLELAGHRRGTLALGWSPDGALLASGGADGTFRLWNTQSGTEAAVLDAGAAWGEHLAWRASGGLLATGAGRFLRLWDDGGELVRSFEPHPSTIGALCWAPRGREISTVCYGGLYLWARHQATPARWSELKSSLLALAWSPDGRLAAAGEQSGGVHLWQANGKGELEMNGYPSKVRQLAWSPDSRWLATSGGEEPVLWDCSGRGPAGRAGKPLKGHEAVISALAFAPGEELLASGDEQGVLCLYVPSVRRRPLAVVELDQPVAGLTWSSSGRTLFVAGGLGAILAYERI